MLQHARARECCSTRARAHGPPAGAAAAVPLNRAAARAHWLRTEEALGRSTRAQGARGDGSPARPSLSRGVVHAMRPRFALRRPCERSEACGMAAFGDGGRAYPGGQLGGKTLSA